MIKLSQIDVRHGPLCLLKEASATIFPGHKVGLVGANGSGKSSLFSVLLGQLAIDRGQVDLPKHWSVAHMAQHIDRLEQSALDFVLDGDEGFRKAQRQVASAEALDPAAQDNALAIAKAHEAFEASGGYQAKARAARLLAGLGFEPQTIDEPIGSFSGGWRIRLSLARALMCPSDLLLLDEPTNHLDLETVTWLEGWLKHYSGTLIIISHDRAFLDAVVDTIIHIEHQSLNTYKGDYSQFEKHRAERLAQQSAQYQKQQHAIVHMQKFIDRFRAKASKAKAAQSRIKALSKLQTIAPAHLDSPFGFEFAPPMKAANPLVHSDQMALGYGDHRVLSDLSIHLALGDRIGLLGLNGAGKSTLIKAIAGELAPQGGQITHTRGLSVGYFAQHQLEQLDTQHTALWHIQALDQSLGLDSNEQSIRDFLGGFGFSGDMATGPIEHFSGGEKARLVLALLVRQRPNVLLLDEPTNHLDLEMRHALTMALQSFEGAVIVVSHDRHLLTNSVDQYWWIHAGKLSMFDGDLEDYRRLIRGLGSQHTSKPSPEHSKKQQRQIKASQRNQLKPLQNKLNRLTRALDELNDSIKALEAQLADPELYHDPQKADEVTRLIALRQSQQTDLERTESEWMATAETLDNLTSQQAQGL